MRDRIVPILVVVLLVVLALLLIRRTGDVDDHPGAGDTRGSRAQVGGPVASPTSPIPATATPDGAQTGGPTSSASSGQADPILVGAGDIGTCASGSDKMTARLIAGIDGTVFAAGDLAYENGTAAQYRDCYDPAWGPFKARTRPVPGNHDWLSGLAPYLAYWGDRAVGAQGDPWYSFDLGAWHVVMLDADCGHVGGCGPDSKEGKWLQADLSASAAACTAAIWHQPRFSSGQHGNDTEVAPFWQSLYAAGAEIVVNGHDHDYERFAPQRPDGTADPSAGIREFVVGTGGTSLRGFETPKANSEVRISTAHGVLRLTLHAHGYDWAFIDVDGTIRDEGSAACH